jgi:protein ImuB
MERLACVHLAEFPLQILLRRHRDWAAYPAAVVADDKPQGLILWVNEKARQFGVLPGPRYAAGCSLAADLRAGEVSLAEVERETEALTKRLIRFTPEVEPSSEEPGVFWLSGAGLTLLYPSPDQWAGALYKEIKTQGFYASVVVGFSRFDTYAAAKAKNEIRVFANPSEERRAVQRVSLVHLDLDPNFREALFKLGINTVGALLSLSPGALYERFGAEAYRLHRAAGGDLWARFAPYKVEEPVRQMRLLDDPESDTTRLLFLIKQLLHPMMTSLAARFQALTALQLTFVIEKAGRLKEQIRPATPTLDLAQLLDLIRLRLESMTFSAGVMEIELRAEGRPATPEQLRLFTEQPARDLDAANRALARLRAEFGDGAVVQAKLTDGHLPEARFTWESLQHVKIAGPKRAVTRTLVRRILAKPNRLSSAPRPTHEDGWLILGHKHGTVDKLAGPYVFSGGWWNQEIQRDYYFAETRRGDIAWVYYDRVRRRWFLQGWIE